MRLGHSKFFRYLSCLIFLGFSLAPCNCLAEDNSNKKRDNSTAAHSCCDEGKKSEQSERAPEHCIDCSDCISTSNHFSDSFIDKTKPSFEQFSVEISKKGFQYAFINLKNQEKIKSQAPPEVQVLSSSKRSSLLQRWLI